MLESVVVRCVNVLPRAGAEHKSERAAVNERGSASRTRESGKTEQFAKSSAREEIIE